MQIQVTVIYDALTVACCCGLLAELRPWKLLRNDTSPLPSRFSARNKDDAAVCYRRCVFDFSFYLSYASAYYEYAK